MSRTTRWIGAGILLALVAAGAGLWMFLSHGISAKDQPTLPEVFIARRLRHLAIPSQARAQVDPTPDTPEVREAGMAHFADHCATCHGNDGSGDTAIGRNLYPKAPDMRLPRTQDLSDGELFYIIENGVRLTGMPAWGDNTDESRRDTWALVRFIRHLPSLTEAEAQKMHDLNPKSPDQFRDEEETRRFLEGDDAAGAPEKDDAKAPKASEPAGGHHH
jgi:mono/diheme cytochrome c family protein